jgi:hypothetical protein
MAFVEPEVLEEQLAIAEPVVLLELVEWMGQRGKQVLEFLQQKLLQEPIPLLSKGILKVYLQLFFLISYFCFSYLFFSFRFSFFNFVF